MNWADPYCYPGTTVLRNMLSITDRDQLDLIERRMGTQRMSEGAPIGSFDLVHLQAIHRHLFQDIYDWAGEIRTVEIAKDGHQFQFCRFIETGMTDIHRRLSMADFLRNLSVEQFAAAAGEIVGDVNYVHPFRDGNGRTQLIYLQQLAEQAGHRLEISHFDALRWISASRSAHGADYGPMIGEIVRIIRMST